MLSGIIPALTGAVSGLAAAIPETAAAGKKDEKGGGGGGGGSPLGAIAGALSGNRFTTHFCRVPWKTTLVGRTTSR